jgi:low affinity Fe/Cu permease
LLLKLPLSKLSQYPWLRIYLFYLIFLKNLAHKDKPKIRIKQIYIIVNTPELNNYFNLKKSLENLLKRQIDLLEDKAVKNPYLRQSIDSSKQLLYG